MIYYLTAIIIAINFLFSAPLSVHAAEESTEETNAWEGTMYSLQDALDGVPEAMDQLRAVGVSFGQAADATISTLINAPVKAVASQFMAVATDSYDAAMDALASGREFLGHIFIDPYNKLFRWNEETVKHGVEITRPLFEDEGLVTVDKWIKCDLETVYRTSGGVYFACQNYAPVKEYYVCYVKNSDTQVRFMFANFNYYNGSCKTSYNANMSNGAYFDMERSRTFPSRTVHYSDTFGDSRFLRPFGESIRGSYLGYYNSTNEAVEALGGGTPSGRPVPNGKGFFRPVPEGEYSASGSNVYNNNWGDIIVNNYKTYGDTFENTTINNYYYYGTSPDTPNYWYDPYPVEPGPTLEGTYDDIQNITLENPNLQTDNMFVSDLFSALPVAVSGFIVSMVLLFVVVLFLRG